jgi:hypothetical protein
MNQVCYIRQVNNILLVTYECTKLLCKVALEVPVDN